MAKQLSSKRRASSSTKTRAGKVAAAEPAAQAAPAATKGAAPAILAILAPAFFNACQAKVNELVPRGEAAGVDPESKKPLRGKGITAEALLLTVGKAYNFPQPTPAKKEEDGEEVEYLKYTAESTEALQVFNYILRSGSLGVVQRTPPLGGYGFEEDKAFWPTWAAERTFGPRARRSRKFPMVWVVLAREAIEKILTIPAGFTPDTKDPELLIPIDSKGEKLGKYAKLSDVAQAMYDLACEGGANPREAARIYLGSSAEDDIRLAVRDGLCGKLDVRGKTVFWLSEEEAAKVEADRQDTNVYDAETNKDGNKKAGNNPEFTFIEWDASTIHEDIDAFRADMPNEGFDAKGGDLLTVEKFISMMEAEQAEEVPEPAKSQPVAQPVASVPPPAPSAPATNSHAPSAPPKVTRRLSSPRTGTNG
jgi:hypothetical protein